ncbi:MAG: hypothetical protein JNN05_04715, partial [Candidatus Omnitrophica bacterium]|nr:hypothetical protein [Candidatus Omnitrophota bacterium]
MNYLLGLIISIALGFLATNAIRSQGKMDPFWLIISSTGLGVAISAHIGFYSLFIAGTYSIPAVWAGHVIIATLLLIINYRIYKNHLSTMLPTLRADRKAWIGLLIASLLLVPLWREAHFFPFGGWDAWASWNLKTKFIFLAGDQWKNMMDPSMWRSNNQYPFFLPLVNAWGWCVAQQPSVSTGLFNAILFSFFTACLMFWGLHRLGKGILSVLPPLVLFSIPFINTLSISQYSDIVLAFYLLGCLTSIIIALREKNHALAMTSGMFCGIMGFIKTEGLLAFMICVVVITSYILAAKKESKSLFPSFILPALYSALPAIFFSLFWSTENVSF